MLGRINCGFIQLFDGVSANGVEPANPHNLIPVQLDSVGLVSFHVGGIHLQHVSTDTKAASVKNGIVSLILQADKLASKGGGIELLALFQVNPHFLVQVGHSQTVNAGHGGHNDNIPPLHEAVGGSKTKTVNFIVN